MDLDNEDFAIPDMVKASVYARGNVIAKFSFLESLIDAFLSYHFGKNQKTAIELIELLFSTNKITFDNKRALAFQILSIHYSDSLSKCKHFNRDMSSIAEQRNIFAHQHIKLGIISNCKYDLDGTLIFTKNQASKNVSEYNFYKIKELLDLINNYIIFFSDLLKQQSTLFP